MSQVAGTPSSSSNQRLSHSTLHDDHPGRTDLPDGIPNVSTLPVPFTNLLPSRSSTLQLENGGTRVQTPEVSGLIDTDKDKDEEESLTVAGDLDVEKGGSPIGKIESGKTAAAAALPLGVPEGYEFPDGGFRAWSVVLGSVFLTMSTFGLANTWGVFQDYYQRTLLSDQSSSNIAWIGSIQYSLVLMPGIISGRLIDLGHLHVPLMVASVLELVAVFLTAECTKYYQFLLCQGLLLGLSAGFLFGPSLAVVAHWFHKKRAIAFGTVALGSSIGGVIFPIASRQLIPKVGFPWTMRILGFILIFTIGCANLLLRTRLPPKNVKGGLLNLALFKNVSYSAYGVACVVGFLGLYTMLTFLDVAATEAGIDADLSFYAIAIANGGSFFGRLASSFIATYIGPMNTLMPFSIVAAAMTWAWPYATDAGYGPLVVVSVIYGIASGAFVGLIGTPLGHPAYGEQGDLGRRMGMIFSLCALGALFGPPISGAIRSASGGFTSVGWYAGSLGFIAVLLMLISKKTALGTFMEKF